VKAHWIKCPFDCDDWMCEEHKLHVYECDCPTYEEYLEQGWDPYNGEEVTYEH
jgi:hypothetical protein